MEIHSFKTFSLNISIDTNPYTEMDQREQPPVQASYNAEGALTVVVNTAGP